MYESRTKKFLWHFKIGSTYRGLYYCIHSVKLAWKDPGCLCSVTKLVYPEIAKRYKTSVNCVERDIRTIAETVWKNGGKEFFYSITGELFEKRPSNSKFLEILVDYILSDEPLPNENNPVACEQCKTIQEYRNEIRKLEEENHTLKESIQKLQRLEEPDRDFSGLDSGIS